MAEGVSAWSGHVSGDFCDEKNIGTFCPVIICKCAEFFRKVTKWHFTYSPSIVYEESIDTGRFFF